MEKSRENNKLSIQNVIESPVYCLLLFFFFKYVTARDGVQFRDHNTGG